jgi:hypothetical protein
MQDRVAVIIVTYNNHGDVRRLIDSLPAGFHPYRAKLHVVDNDSTDGTADLLEENAARVGLDVEVHRSPVSLGYTDACNLAMKQLAARGWFDFFVLLNPDTEVCPGWLEELLRPFRGNDHVGITGSVLLLPDGRVNALGCSIHYLGFGFMDGYGRSDLPETPPPISYACGAALAISRACLQRVVALSGDEGIFWSPLQFYHDDLDLGWRSRLIGFRPALAMNSRVVHHHEFTGHLEQRSKFWIMERNRFLVLLCNYRMGTVLLLLPWLLLCELYLLVSPRLLGRKERVVVYLDVARCLRDRRFWSRRRRIQSRRSAPDRAIMQCHVGVIDHPLLAGSNRIVDSCSNLIFALLKAIVRW